MNGLVFFQLGLLFHAQGWQADSIMFRVEEVSPMVFRYDVICG